MERHQKGSVEWLTFEIFSECPRLVHGIFLRHGGVSSHGFDSLNLGFTQGDVPNKVIQNRKKTLEILKIQKYQDLYQCHGNQVLEAPCSKKKADALLTQQPNLGLLILHADCQAAIFYDPIHHVIANVHSGWRGSVHNIYKTTMERMRQRYNSRAEDLLVGISPSLGPQAAEFQNYEKELPKTFWSFQTKHLFFDFWEISRHQLMECGVLNHHIEIAGICTYSNPQDFFSYRRLKVSGRHGSLVALLE